MSESIQAQKEQSITQFLNNTTIQIGDTSVSLMDVFDKNQEILFHAEKLQKDVDSLLLEIAKLESINAAQLLRDSAQTKVFYLSQDNVKQWKSKYEKLSKVNKLNGIIGGGISTNYSIESKHFTAIAININMGLMFKQKYITTLGVGFNLNREIVFGLNTSMVF